MSAPEARLTHFMNSMGLSKASAAALTATPTSSVRNSAVVVVTGACGNIAYSVLNMIGAGEMLGKDQPVELRLLDIPAMAKNLDGVAMELKDCAYPLVTKIVCTTDYATAFADADVALLIGARPRGPGMDRADLLKANAAIFEGQGKAINANAMIAMMNAPDIPATQFHAMTRLDHNRAVGLLADRLGVNAGQVKNVVIWGNHSNTMYPDTAHGVIVDSPSAGMVSSIHAAVNDAAWLSGDFVNTVALRGGAIIKARGKSSAASAAQAAVHHVRDWALGTPKGEWVAMSVPSDGSYGVPKGLVFSFPCVAANGHYQIVQGLQLSEEAKAKIAANVKELEGEKAAAGY